MVKRELFGGALTCDIPEQYVDVSEIRQVPDHQEVFADPKSDRSVMIDILQYEDDIADSDSAEYFLGDIATANGCSEGDALVLQKEFLSSEIHMPLIGAEFHKSAALGQQKVAKFKESDEAKNTVMVYLCNIRLPNVSTDIVISLNIPTNISSHSSSVKCFEPGSNDAMGSELIQMILRTFEIRDWSLFG